MKLEEAYELARAGSPFFSRHEAQAAMQALMEENDRLQTLLFDMDGKLEVLEKQISQLAKEIPA